jgi:two-component system OmpR family response regulator
MDAIALHRRTLSPLRRESTGGGSNAQDLSSRKIRSVLYVDDDPEICQVVRATLSLMAGLDVHVASCGVAAITIAHELMPDLVLMDVMMPGLDGPATLKRMQESAPIANIPVIFLTAKQLPAEVAHFLQLGAIGVIGKPFDPLKLGDEVFALWASADARAQVMATECVRVQVKTEVDSLTNTFLVRTRGDVVRLRQMAERAQQGEASALREIGRLAHTIHGAGAMFGCPEVSAAAGAMEAWADEATANLSVPGFTFEPAVFGPLAEFMHRLSQETEAAASSHSTSESGCIGHPGRLRR